MTLNVDRGCTVLLVKHLLREAGFNPVWKQRLSMNSGGLVEALVLEDYKLLAEYNLTNMNVVYLTELHTIFIDQLNGSSFPLWVEPFWVINYIKSMIRDELDIPNYEQGLLFGRVVLADEEGNETLEYYHVENGSHLTLLRYATQLAIA